MATVGLLLYTFQMIHSYQEDGEIKHENLKLNNTRGKLKNAEDIFALFRDFCSDRNLHTLARKSFKVVKTQQFNVEKSNRKFKHMQIEIQYGETGYVAPILDVDTNKEVHTKKKNQAEMKTMYVSVIVENDINGTKPIIKGFLLFETFGQISIKTRFTGELHQFIASNYDINAREESHTYKLELGEVINKNYAIQALRQSAVKDIQLIAYSNKDESNKLDDEFEYDIEQRVYKRLKKEQKTIDKFVEFLNGRRGLTDVLEVKDFEYDDIKVTLEKDGKSKVLDMGKIERNNIRIYLPNDIIGVDGYPKEEELRKEAEEIYCIYSEEINLR